MWYNSEKMKGCEIVQATPSEAFPVISTIQSLSFLEWLTVAAFIMSSLTWANELLHKRRKLRITPLSYMSKPSNSEKNAVLFLHLNIENKSRISIAVTSISAQVGGDFIDCNPISHVYFTNISRQGGEIVNQVERYSLGMPINLASLEATSGVLLFELPTQDALDASIPLNVRLTTTRGTIDVTLPLCSVRGLDSMMLL